MKKGVHVLFIIIPLMLLASIVTASLFFTKNMIFQKREFEEEILSVGNEIETYAHLIDSADDLAMIQAIHDVGNNVILDENYEYGPNYLPYWSSLSEDEIKSKIERLSQTYFNSYVKNYADHFEERNENKYNQWKGITWKLKWNPDVKITEMDDSHVNMKFGDIIITYESKRIELIERRFSIESEVKTNFDEILDKGMDIIDEVNSLTVVDQSKLDEIKSGFETGEISVELTLQDTFVSVFINEKVEHPVYDFIENKVKQDSLGLKFLIDLDGSPTKEITVDRENVKKCVDSGWIVRSTNDNICSLFLGS